MAHKISQTTLHVTSVVTGRIYALHAGDAALKMNRIISGHNSANHKQATVHQNEFVMQQNQNAFINSSIAESSTNKEWKRKVLWFYSNLQLHNSIREALVFPRRFWDFLLQSNIQTAAYIHRETDIITSFSDCCSLSNIGSFYKNLTCKIHKFLYTVHIVTVTF